MDIRYTKSFQKAYDHLSARDKGRTDKAIETFAVNPHDPRLRNHPLKGKHLGKWAFSAGFDLRIIYRKEGPYIVVILLDVGTHGQVY